MQELPPTDRINKQSIYHRSYLSGRVWTGLVIEVRLFASLRRYGPTVSDTGMMAVDVAEGISLGELLDELEINPTEIKTMKVNGLISGMDQLLADGDRVDLFPGDFAGQSA